MRFGFHVSIAGGLSKVLGRARERRCETIQFFSRNPRGWKYGPLDSEEVKRFRKDFEDRAIWPIFVHMPYLPNLASPNSQLYSTSVDSLVEDLGRAEALGAEYVVTHVGSSLGKSADFAIGRVAQAVNRSLARAKNSVILLLENTAGSGSEIGSSFEQVAQIIKLVDYPDRIGVALDTAHAFEAGYDFRTETAVEKTINAFNSIVGLEKLHLVHLNDSKSDLGSKADRHWHIGEGKIGLEGFSYIVNHRAFRNIPGIMETPRKDTDEDLKNMKVVRSLVKQKTEKS